MALVVILAAFGLLIVFGPSLWAQHVLRKHAAARGDFPGTGGELARHLLDRFGLQAYACEQTDAGDHFDPTAAAVRLSQQHFDGRSLSAVVVAAHEVGHAIQHRDGHPMLRLRTQLVPAAKLAERIGVALACILPVGIGWWQSPRLGLMFLVLGLMIMGLSVLVHLVTLPVELDASFGKALPVLEQGGYLPPADLAPARQILLACALTYVAAALRGLLDLGRWIMILRGR